MPQHCLKAAAAPLCPSASRRCHTHQPRPLPQPLPPADTIGVVGVTAAGKEVPGANTLALRTPRLGAPTIAAADATGPTTALVRLTPPTTSQNVSLYMVRVCLKAAPTSCVARNSTSILVPFSGLTAGSSNLVSATALIGGTVVPASNSLPLLMPGPGSPVLLTAEAASAFSGTATAAAPKGVTFARVGRGCWGVALCA